MYASRRPHTYQSDVETVHRLEEDEFFDLEDFASRGDFLAKVHRSNSVCFHLSSSITTHLGGYDVGRLP